MATESWGLKIGGLTPKRALALSFLYILLNMHRGKYIYCKCTSRWIFTNWTPLHNQLPDEEATLLVSWRPLGLPFQCHCAASNGRIHSSSPSLSAHRRRRLLWTVSSAERCYMADAVLSTRLVFPSWRLSGLSPPVLLGAQCPGLFFGRVLLLNPNS